MAEVKTSNEVVKSLGFGTFIIIILGLAYGRPWITEIKI
ncbi:putative membrane protein [Moraxella catarrhalis]|uniref:Membrane protein n=1 Tax=Moraxella catarrhalis TaxID=480 RepID=A0ABY0BLA5_MORCA|nr:putative membrane protein [Moraxella catarrhalis]RUO16545.1 putative membrane protein [Moraxella catarrhalis]RUO17331.1 putative membrane protein [Moraxella catarrhalis]